MDELKENRGYCKLKGSTRSHSVENWLWNGLWACRKADCGKNERQAERKKERMNE
jgi:hypothetical protein